MPRVVSNKELIARGARLKNGGALALQDQKKVAAKPPAAAGSPDMVGAIDRLADAIGRLADAIATKQPA